VNELEALPGEPTEQECSAALMRTAMILHPFDAAYAIPRQSYLLAEKGICVGQLSYEDLASLGAQA
jgi:hypothetical protein